MTIHLQKFIDRLRGFEARGSKDFTMSIQEAKDLHADITGLLIALQTLQQVNNTKTDSTIEVQIQGGTFK